MEKEFNVLEKLDLPKRIFWKKIKEYTFAIDKSKANWLVLDENELKLFKYLEKDTIINSLRKYSNDNPDISEESILIILEKLLYKIETEKFYNSLLEVEQEDIFNLKKTVHLELTNDCNLRCKHCYMSAGILEKKEINYMNLIEFFEKNINMYSREIIVSGGEPLTYYKIWDLLDYLKKSGHKVILFSNGLLINESNINLIKENVSEVQLSMEGISKEAFESIRGKDTYNLFIRALELLSINEIKTTLAVTVLDENIEDINQNLVTFLKTINHNNINVRINDDIELSGNAINLKNQDFEFNYYRKKQINQIILELSEIGFYEDLDTTKRVKILNCGIGTSIHLDYNENIYPCSKKGSIFFSLEDVIRDNIDLEKNFSTLNNESGVNFMDECKYCELQYICSGGCRIDNINNNGKWSIPYCNKEEKYEMLLVDYLRKEDCIED